MSGWYRRKKADEPIRQARIVDMNEAYLFRRSRTITGSPSSAVHSATESGADLQSARLKHHDLRLRRRKLSVVLLSSLAGIVSISFLLSQYISHVVTVTEVIPVSKRAQYETAVHSYLSAHPSERFLFSLNQSALLTAVQQQYPEIASLEISDGGFFRPSDFTPVVREPVVAWTLGQTTLFIDAEGVSFETLYTSPPALVVEDKTGIDPDDAGAVASARLLRYIGRLVTLVQADGLVVEKVQLPAGTSRRVDIYLQGRTYPFKTSSDRDPAGQASDVRQALQYIEGRGIVPQYIDVRVSSKAYYL